MAFCANCGSEMSDQAPFCPNCGHPNEALPGGAISAPGLTLAGFWRRFAARVLDALILIIPNAIFAGDLFASTLISFGYHWLMIGLVGGQTLGKKALGIRIVKADGAPVDLGTAAAREGMAIVSGLALLLGYLWAIWDPENRTWHDMVANTRATVV